jgi:Spy/CpxP family protein refolding chaperone
MARRVDKTVEWVLSDVDATAEQKQKVAAIAKQALADMAPMRERHQAARRQAVELLGAPAIDRSALERLRADELRLAEDASKRLVQSLADIAEALTPEQRAKLKERLERRMARRGA